MYFLDTEAHSYSCAVIGLSKRHNKVFPTREAANAYMYKLCKKYGLCGQHWAHRGAGM